MSRKMPSETVKQDMELGRRIIGNPDAPYRLGISERGMPGSPKTIRMFETRDALCEYIRNATRKPMECYNLMGLDLSGGDLSGADLSFAVCKGGDFSGTKFDGATFVSTSMREANFAGASFKGAQMDNPDMSYADFTKADFTGERLKNNVGKGIILNGARFTDARLRVCVFVEGSLIKTDFSKASISRLFLDFSDAAMARFKGATVSQFVSVTNTNLSGASVPHDLKSRFNGKALCAPGMACCDLRRIKHKRPAPRPGGA